MREAEVKSNFALSIDGGYWPGRCDTHCGGNLDLKHSGRGYFFTFTTSNILNQLNPFSSTTEQALSMALATSWIHAFAPSTSSFSRHSVTAGNATPS